MVGMYGFPERAVSGLKALSGVNKLKLSEDWLPCQRATTPGLPFSYGVFEKHFSSHEPLSSESGIATIGTTALVNTQAEE